MSAASSASAFADTEPPLWDGLGSITYKITTANERAQAYFNQGLRLAYAFNHDEARRAFRMAQKLDPDCAMCFWGEALVLGPNINLPMPEDAVAPAYAAAQKAKALAGKASPREQALIGALRFATAAIRRLPARRSTQPTRLRWRRLANQFSGDDEIATLYAEAVMDLSPWDYWKPGGREAKPQSAPIVPTLERVLARNPGSSGRHSPLHPRRRGLGPAQARRALCRPAARRRSQMRAISCTCRATSTIGSAAISMRWKTTRRRSRSTKNTLMIPTRRWASTGWATIRITCTS